MRAHYRHFTGRFLGKPWFASCPLSHPFPEHFHGTCQNSLYPRVILDYSLPSYIYCRDDNIARDFELEVFCRLVALSVTQLASSHYLALCERICNIGQYLKKI